MYINIIDFEKAIDSTDRDSLWKIETFQDSKQVCISHQGNLQGMTCRVLHESDMSESFNAQTEARKTKEHLTKIRGRRDARCGTQLAHTCSDGTEQSQMERDCKWPMLCTSQVSHIYHSYVLETFI